MPIISPDDKTPYRSGNGAGFLARAEESIRQRTDTRDKNGSSILLPTLCEAFLSMNRGIDAEREEHRIIVFIIIHGLMRLLKGMKLCVSGFSECGFIRRARGMNISKMILRGMLEHEKTRAEWSEEKISKH